jgi:hypothetical protein
MNVLIIRPHRLYYVLFGSLALGAGLVGLYLGTTRDNDIGHFIVGGLLALGGFLALVNFTWFHYFIVTTQTFGWVHYFGLSQKELSVESLQPLRMVEEEGHLYDTPAIKVSWPGGSINLNFMFYGDGWVNDFRAMIAQGNGEIPWDEELEVTRGN